MATASPRPAEPHSIGYNMAVIMLATALVGLLAAYGLNALVRARPHAGAVTDAGPRLTRTLVGKTLHIPAAWVRSGETVAGGVAGGFASRIDLALTLPLGKGGKPAPVKVALLPLSQVRTSASLLDGVYLHAFMPDELSGPPGLVGKPLNGTGGFENETVWYDALAQNPFVANCIAPPDNSGPGQCLRIVALSGGIAAVYAFDADLLDNWKSFDPEMSKRLTDIGAL